MGVTSRLNSLDDRLKQELAHNVLTDLKTLLHIELGRIRAELYDPFSRSEELAANVTSKRKSTIQAYYGCIAPDKFAEAAKKLAGTKWLYLKYKSNLDNVECHYPALVDRYLLREEQLRVFVDQMNAKHQLAEAIKRYAASLKSHQQGLSDAVKAQASDAKAMSAIGTAMSVGASAIFGPLGWIVTKIASGIGRSEHQNDYVAQYIRTAQESVHQLKQAFESYWSVRSKQLEEALHVIYGGLLLRLNRDLKHFGLRIASVESSPSSGLTAIYEMMDEAEVPKFERWMHGHLQGILAYAQSNRLHIAWRILRYVKEIAHRNDIIYEAPYTYQGSRTDAGSVLDLYEYILISYSCYAYQFTDADKTKIVAKFLEMSEYALAHSHYKQAIFARNPLQPDPLFTGLCALLLLKRGYADHAEQLSGIYRFVVEAIKSKNLFHRKSGFFKPCIDHSELECIYAYHAYIVANGGTVESDLNSDLHREYSVLPYHRIKRYYEAHFCKPETLADDPFYAFLKRRTFRSKLLWPIYRFFAR